MGINFLRIHDECFICRYFKKVFRHCLKLFSSIKFFYKIPENYFKRDLCVLSRTFFFEEKTFIC